MSPPTARLAWVDNLRTVVIVLVVNMHACVTYSHVGDWYIMENPEPPMSLKILFFFWQGHLQSFFMGLLFFIAGYFAHRSLERHGTAGFLRERLFRLGLPSLLYMLVIHPFMIYVLLGLPRIQDRPPLGTLYERYLTSARLLRGSGPMWFALALLMFCVVLAAWRALRGKPASAVSAKSRSPCAAALLAFGALLVVATFGVRLVQPIGENVFNFQLCFFPQYIAAFAAGVMAGRGGWLEELVQSRAARIAGWLGLFGGPLLLAAVLFIGGPPAEHGPNLYLGGWHGQAFGLALWEQLTGLALGLGLLALCRARFDQESAVARWLSRRAFGVYALHPPVLLALTLLLRSLNTDPFTHAALLTFLGVAASYAAAEVALRIPGLRSIL